MSKELMQKFLDQTLDEGYYYLASKMGGTFIYEINPCALRNLDVADVIARVPEYEKFIEYYSGFIHYKKECKRLSEELRNETVSNDMLCKQVKGLCSKIKKLESQLDEAHDILKWCDKALNFGVTEELSYIQKYFKKWGVK